MKTIKDKNYSFNHVKKRLTERYNCDITISEYDELCYMIKKCWVTPITVEKQKNNIQEIYDIVFNKKMMKVVWSIERQLITTVLPN